MAKGQGNWERKCKKSFFVHVVVQSGSIYIKQRPE